MLAFLPFQAFVKSLCVIFLGGPIGLNRSVSLMLDKKSKGKRSRPLVPEIKEKKFKGQRYCVWQEGMAKRDKVSG